MWTGVLGAVAGLAISIIMALIIKNYWALSGCFPVLVLRVMPRKEQHPEGDLDLADVG
jgi:hypothetical protein